MSHSRNNNIVSDKNRKDVTTEDAQELEDESVHTDPPNRVSYSVTLSEKDAPVDTETACSGQKSFISIHSTDLPFRIHPDSVPKLAECNVEVLSLKECFPSTSEESLANEDDLTSKNTTKNAMRRTAAGNAPQKPYTPSNSKSTTNERIRSERQDVQATGHSDFDIPKSTLHVIGSNPGEPKKCYNDPPKKISKTMRKFLRSIDRQPSERARSTERANLTRGILKERRWAECAECTGDAQHDSDDAASEQSLSFMEWSAPSYTKQGHPSTDKNVTFNTQVIIIHFTGDLCMGQSVEALSKERDQQARNSELRRTFLTKYNEFWPQKL